MTPVVCRQTFCRADVRLRRVLPLAILVAGCSGQPAATVSGTVALDGRPLTTGTVTLHPAGGGPLAYGSIDAEGRFQITRHGDPRIAPGRYAATVVASEAPAVPADGSMPTPGRPIAPTRYANAETSGLGYEIGVGENAIEIALVSTQH